MGLGGRLTEGSTSVHFSSCSSSLKSQELERLQHFRSMLHSPQTLLKGHKPQEPVWPPSDFFIDKYRVKVCRKGRKKIRVPTDLPANNQELMKTRKVIHKHLSKEKNAI